MVEHLRGRTAGRPCMVIESDFETAALPPGVFHVGAAATSFHWVDPQLGMARMAEALVPDGWLALWWTVFRDVDDPDDAVQREIGRIAERYRTSGRRETVPFALDVTSRRAEIEAGGRFQLVEHHHLPFRVVHTPASMRDLFATFSTWASLPEPDRSRALDELAALVAAQPGASLARTYVTVLYLARRSGS